MDPQGHEEHLGLAAVARRRAALARERAERAEAAAQRHELLAKEPGRDFHAQIAQTHRRTAACHRASQRLQEDFALRAAQWDRGYGTRPRFMTGVAEACGMSSAAVTLVDAGQNQLAIAVSDEQSRAAQELEYVLGDGPTRDAASARRPLHVSGRAIEARWPGYGVGLASLGLASVAALPLPSQDRCMGVLTVFDPRLAPVRRADLTEVAAALTRIVLLGPDADAGLYGEIDIRAIVLQATGMLSEQLGRPVADALALIKARAFAEDVSIETIARQIVHGDLKLS
ncbi:GAF and ANTAR domain-containing protein [Streptomyces sp. HD]|uniref:GAF and ANTAR domain-containing protein n=1 Tax=Streptomyces sp. HD TaxID=3020892 RepID=UPI00232E29DA|nr:GAF and ANTAR domain-containing protein [Streptomyces sp. HD]MDC0768434.1 GAF and ANTAR domain-containing protein [Streptomyces sp. HD]